MGEHYIVKCRGCGAVVEQCLCPDRHGGAQEVRHVPTCSACMEPAYPNEVGFQLVGHFRYTNCNAET